MKKIFYFCFLFASQIFAFGAADSVKLDPGEKVIVDSIVIKGNDITKDYIILRELTFGVGDTVSVQDLKYDRERVYSIGLFARVDLYFSQIKPVSVLVIDVLESWYIYPLPFLTIRENSLKKSTYGMSLLYKNFRGRNETIGAVVSLGYNPSYSLTYYNPLINYEKSLSLGFSFAYGKVNNMSRTAELLYGGEFEYRLFSLQLELGKRINQFNYAAARVKYRHIESPFAEPGVTSSGEKIDRVLSFGLSYSFDTRDLAQFPESGLYAGFRITQNGLGFGDIDYNVFITDFRQYFNFIGDLRTKYRLTTRNTFGSSIPYYEFSYFGYDEYVRGHRFDKQEGRHYALGSFELSHPLIKEWNLSFKLPYLPRKLTSARLAFHIAAFFDTGMVYDDDRDWRLSSLESGYGVALIGLILPYNAFRLEYAFDEFNNGELLFGTGFSF